MLFLGMTNLKINKVSNIALVHDWFSSKHFGGAEKTLFIIDNLLSREFESPDLFGLIKDIKKKKYFNWLEEREVNTTFIQNLPLSKSNIQFYLPFLPLAIEQLNLDNYKLIISSSHLAAKGVITSPDQCHIAYIHTPMRYAWDQMNIYLKSSTLSKLGLEPLIRYFLYHLRSWDYISSQRIDYLIANSNFTAKRIKKYWGRESKVIFPPVNVNRFNYNKNRGDYYLSVSRLVPNKRVDLIVKAFNKLKYPLIIIGDGVDKNYLKKIKGENIKILGFQSDQVIKKMMEQCRAFVYAGTEDFGIAPVEAMAAGAPVIGLEKGGLIDTVKCINKENNNNPTGVFFKSTHINEISQCIEWFEEKKIWKKFNPSELNKWASKFNEENFSTEFKDFINKVKPNL